MTRGCTVWFTGLPCSGKSTLSRMLFDRLSRLGLPVELLDGDELRKHFSAGVGFSKEERAGHLRRVSYLCQMLTKHGVIVVASFVSPYRENREYARGLIGDRFAEVFTDSSVEACMRRDVKGMYKRAMAGEIKQFTGVSDPYERPERPELLLKTDEEKTEESMAKLMNLLRDRYGIPVP
jgi:adenylylsulfate kinase